MPQPSDRMPVWAIDVKYLLRRTDRWGRESFTFALGVESFQGIGAGHSAPETKCRTFSSTLLKGGRAPKPFGCIATVFEQLVLGRMDEPGAEPRSMSTNLQTECE